VTAPAAPLTAAVLAAALLAGCGASSTEDSSGRFKGEQRLVANAIEDLQSAGQRREAAKICNDLLTAELVRAIRVASDKRKCSDAMNRSLRDADTFELTVERVNVAGNRAIAVVRSGSKSDEQRTDTLRLVKVGEPRRWRVADLGLQP
jgi:hypothetical protein